MLNKIVQKAIEYYLKALEIRENIDDKRNFWLLYKHWSNLFRISQHIKP